MSEVIYTAEILIIETADGVIHLGVIVEADFGPWEVMPLPTA